MKPGAPILFYESKRSGGRGAIIAVGRISDVTIVRKSQVDPQLLRRGVVEDLEQISVSEDVIASSFDALLRFPTEVRLSQLQKLDAVGKSNLQKAQAIPYETLSAILKLGWSRV
jgi:hypothetical protein